jgi:hypothetical protein
VTAEPRGVRPGAWQVRTFFRVDLHAWRSVRRIALYSIWRLVLGGVMRVPLVIHVVQMDFYFLPPTSEIAGHVIAALLVVAFCYCVHEAHLRR